jgi:hypothetical protein
MLNHEYIKSIGLTYEFTNDTATYLRVHKRHGYREEVDVIFTIPPIVCRVEIRADVFDWDGFHSQAKLRLLRSHPVVGLAHWRRVVLVKADEHELTLKFGLGNPPSQALDVFVGVGHHDKILNFAHSHGSAVIITDVVHVVAGVLPLPGASIDGNGLLDDLDPAIVVVLRIPPQTCLHVCDLHPQKRKC